MARVTVEDCLARVPNRFALTILASRRARSLSEGRGRAMIDCENKEGVTALREISADRVRYKEDVANTMVDFIEEQRRQLRVTTGEHTFLEAASLRALEDDDIDGDEVDDEDDDIEELQADPEALNKQAKKVTADDESEDEEETADAESADDEDSEFVADDSEDFVADDDDDDLADDSDDSEESDD